MHSEDFSEPDNENDKRIFHVLSHGQKRQYEIARLAAISKEGKDTIKERTRDLAESYPWAKEVEENGTTYYYRADIGRQPNFRRVPADYEDIEELLSGIEIRLGIKSRDQIGITNPTSATLPVLFGKLLEEAIEHGQLLTTDQHLDRFSECFDRMIEQTKNGFSTAEPANYPGKTHGLFYTVIARQHEGWKKGQSHEEFNRLVQERLDDLLDLLDFVPPEVGSPILRVLVLCDINKAQEKFLKLVRSNEYDESKLVILAEASFAHTHNTDELIEELSWLGMAVLNRHTAVEFTVSQLA